MKEDFGTNPAGVRSDAAAGDQRAASVEGKHTSGPWEHAATFPPGDFVIYSKTAKGRIESECKRVAYIYSENEADARVIAAAPDMLEALRYILSHIADKDRSPRDLYPAFGLNSSRAIEMTRAAIAKAEGQTRPNDDGTERGRARLSREPT